MGPYPSYPINEPLPVINVKNDEHHCEKPVFHITSQIVMQQNGVLKSERKWTCLLTSCIVK